MYLLKTLTKKICKIIFKKICKNFCSSKCKNSCKFFCKFSFANFFAKFIAKKAAENFAEKFAIFNADPISKTNIVSDVETDVIASLPSSWHHFRRQKKIYNKTKKKKLPWTVRVDAQRWDRTANLEVTKRAPYLPGQGGTDNILHLDFVFILPKLKMIKSASRPNTIKNRIKW